MIEFYVVQIVRVESVRCAPQGTQKLVTCLPDDVSEVWLRPELTRLETARLRPKCSRRTPFCII